jgi:benzoyl-CoA reductase subunit C
MKKFEEAAGPLPNSWINEWKSDGKPVIGYFCCYIPDEIIHAANILPYRISARGHKDTTQADTYLSRLNCSSARCILDKALTDGFRFGDGLVAFNSCDHMRRMYDNWKYKVPYTGFSHFMSIPHHTDELAIKWFVKEIKDLKKAIEKHFNVQITDDNIKESTQIYSKSRELLKKLYDTRKTEDPRINGSEILKIMTSSTSIRREDFNEMLEKFLDLLAEREPIIGKPRIMVMGSVLDDPEYVDIIEHLGGLVVTDSLCFGTRSFWDMPDSSQDPIENLAIKYLRKSPCPRMIDQGGDFQTRLKFMLNMIKEFHIDGVIFENMKFCDFWTGEGYMTQKKFKELGVPILDLEREYITSGIGQMKTRVQAFLEVLE